MQVATKQHVWVKHTITPVHVLGLDDNDEPIILVDPDDQAAAEIGSTAYGCDRCGVPLWGHLGSPCEPDDD